MRCACSTGLSLLIAAGLAATFTACHGRGEVYDTTIVHLNTSADDANNVLRIEHRDLPNKKLITNYNELVSRGLIGPLIAIPEDQRPWAASFFPVWLGGAAGRWKDNKIVLFWRTLFGFGTLDSDESFKLAHASPDDPAAQATVSGLSPTEKYDMAVGDYSMLATRFEAMGRGHNIPGMLTTVPFWAGYCNGIAVAGIRYREPVQSVEAIGIDGQRVRFEPTDIKALLGLTQSTPERLGWQLGNRCDSYSTDSPDCNDVNPASLVVALANRIGIAKKSFTLDMNPLAPVINVSIRTAQIAPVGPVRTVAPGSLPLELKAVSALVDVHFDIEVASTLVSPNSDKKGLIDLKYEAELALSETGELIGGRWTGPKMSGPDFAWGASNEPYLIDASHGHVMYNPYVHYSIVAALARASAAPVSSNTPVVDLTPILEPETPDLFIYGLPDSKVRVQRGRPARIYGRVPAHLGHMNCRSLRDSPVAPFWTDSPGDNFTLIYDFPAAKGRLAYFDVGADAPDKNAGGLDCAFYERGSDVPSQHIKFAIFNEPPAR